MGSLTSITHWMNLKLYFYMDTSREVLETVQSNCMRSKSNFQQSFKSKIFDKDNMGQVIIATVIIYSWLI